MIKIFRIIIFITVFVNQFLYSNSEDEEEQKYFNIFKQIYQRIKNEYIEKKSPEELFTGAIEGMLKKLNDPHTAFLKEQEKQELQIETKGEYGGLGIVVGIRDNKLTVISPIEDTPAERAGIKAGDVILKIDGVEVKEPKINEVVKKLRGEPNTTVTLTIKRENIETPIDYTLTRAIIKLKTVKYDTIKTNIGYIKLTSFSQNTPEELKSAIDSLFKKNIKALIVDLRNNPGGLLDVAIKVSDYFLSEGLIVYTKARTNTFNPFLNQRYYAHKNDNLIPDDMPLVILINKGSASASEIFAGAIQDNNRGIIVGTKSFGKGSVQSVIDLDNNSALRYTTAYYYTPKGKLIHNIGIIPDIEIEDINPSKMDYQNINKIYKNKYISNFLNEHPQWTDSDIDELLKKLNEDGIEIDKILLKRLIREEEARNKQKPFIDLEIDPQLKMAVQIALIKFKYK